MNLAFPKNEKLPCRRRLNFDTPFKCSDCGLKFKWEQQLLTHQPVHWEERKWHCNSCEKSFKDEQELQSHRKMHLEDKSNKCELCCKIFKSKAGLISHQRSHSRDRMLKCNLCNKSFKVSVLKYHIKTHTNGTHDCTHCDQKFERKHKLKKHIHAHFVDASFQSNKFYKSDSSLDNSTIFHSQE